MKPCEELEATDSWSAPDPSADEDQCFVYDGTPNGPLKAARV